MQEQLDQITSISWLLVAIGSVIGSIILSIFANLLTPVARNWYLRLSPLTKEKKLANIKKDLENINSLNSSPKLLWIECFDSLIVGLVFITLGIFLFLLGANLSSERLSELVMYLAGTTSFGIGGRIMLSFSTKLRKIRHYDVYKKDAEERIRLLEARGSRAGNQEVS